MRNLFLVFLTLLIPLKARSVEPLWTDDNIPAAVLARLTQAQDLALDMQYDKAEAMIRAAALGAPRHPLCGVFLVATLLSRIQENIKAGTKSVPPAFFDAATRLVDEIQSQKSAYPDSPYPRLYLGAAYGMRGLAKLYAGDYLSSYFDGKKGAAALKQAVHRDPKLYNAYMGLGQFEYYCGTLSGALQFFLALPGDPQKGLAMLQICGEKGTYAAWPCRAYRVRLMTNERGQYAQAALELVALEARYPDNYDFARALFRSLDARVNTEALRAAAAACLVHLAAGWTPPKHAHMDSDAMRWTLARAYLAAGDRAAARGTLKPLLDGHGPWAGRAEGLLSSIPRP